MVYISLKELAEQLQMDRSACRKYFLKKGFRFNKIRTPDSGNQMNLALSKEEAERAIRVRQQDGYNVYRQVNIQVYHNEDTNPREITVQVTKVQQPSRKATIRIF